MKLQGPQAAERARAVIERQVDHLIHLVDDLIDVARIARGKIELRSSRSSSPTSSASRSRSAGPMLEQRAHTLKVERAAPAA